MRNYFARGKICSRMNSTQFSRHGNFTFNWEIFSQELIQFSRWDRRDFFFAATDTTEREKTFLSLSGTLDERKTFHDVWWSQCGFQKMRERLKGSVWFLVNDYYFPLTKISLGNTSLLISLHFLSHKTLELKACISTGFAPKTVIDKWRN